MRRSTVHVSLLVVVTLLVPNLQWAAAQAQSQATRAGTAPNAPGQADRNNSQTERANQATNKSSASAQGSWKDPDHCFATCVALGNQEEVVLAKLASQKAQNEEVKKFAEMMLHDHQDYLTKLLRFAPEAARPGYLASGDGQSASTKGSKQIPAGKADENERPASQNRAETADGARPDNVHHMQLQQIERELAQQCLASATEKLSQKSGAEFDKCFIHMQIAKHAGMKDKLVVYQRHASKELAEVLAAGQKTTEHHLVKAEEISKSLEHGTSAGKVPVTKEKNRSDK